MSGSPQNKCIIEEWFSTLMFLFDFTFFSEYSPKFCFLLNPLSKVTFIYLILHQNLFVFITLKNETLVPHPHNTLTAMQLKSFAISFYKLFYPIFFPSKYITLSLTAAMIIVVLCCSDLLLLLFSFSRRLFYDDKTRMKDSYLRFVIKKNLLFYCLSFLFSILK